VGDNTLLERFVAALNENVFFAEFSFSRTRLRLVGGFEDELADHVVRLGPFLFLYQCKERGPSGTITIEKWIRREVMYKAIKQLKKTINFLHNQQPLLIPNERGLFIDLSANQDDVQFRVVLFQSGSERTPLPYPQYHISRTIGFVHVFDIFDYWSICEYLITPVELAEYFEWREYLLKSTKGIPCVSEQAMLGQYLLEEYQSQPSEKYRDALTAFFHNVSAFDLTGLFSKFGDHIEYSKGGDLESSYYRILELFAQMNRSELQSLKSRIRLALDAVLEDRFEKPWRFVSSRLNCGVLINPVVKKLYKKRLSFLKNYCRAAKYEQRTKHQIGISIALFDTDFLIEWSLTSFPWQPDPNIDKLLFQNNPLRPLRTTTAPLYSFSSDALRNLGMTSDHLDSE